MHMQLLLQLAPMTSPPHPSPVHPACLTFAPDDLPRNAIILTQSSYVRTNKEKKTLPKRAENDGKSRRRGQREVPRDEAQPRPVHAPAATRECRATGQRWRDAFGSGARPSDDGRALARRPHGADGVVVWGTSGRHEWALGKRGGSAEDADRRVAAVCEASTQVHSQAQICISQTNQLVMTAM
jgi:hypothetical protein